MIHTRYANGDHVMLNTACTAGEVSQSRLDLQLGMFKEAKDDCNAALELSCTIKSLIRRGKAYVGLDDIPSAIQDFKQVLTQEPSNRYACMGPCMLCNTCTWSWLWVPAERINM